MAAKLDFELELRRLAARMATAESDIKELRSAGVPKCSCGRTAAGRIRVFEGAMRSARDIYACTHCAEAIGGQPV